MVSKDKWLYELWSWSDKHSPQLLERLEKEVFPLVTGYMISPQIRADNEDDEAIVLAQTWKVDTLEEFVSFLNELKEFYLYVINECVTPYEDRCDKHYYIVRGYPVYKEDLE